MATTHDLPLAPGAWPMLGQGPAMLRDPSRFLISLSRHGGLVRVTLGPMRVVVVCDPELARQVFQDDRTYDKGGPLWNRAREFLGDGVANCPHSRHRRLRRLCQPSFHPQRVSGCGEIATEGMEKEIKSWRDGEILDVKHTMARLTSANIVRLMFSVSLSPAEVRRIGDDVVILTRGAFRRMALPPAFARLPLPANRRYNRANENIRRRAGQLIDQRRAEGVDHGDLLSALLAAVDTDSASDQRRLTDTEAPSTGIPGPGGQ